MENGVTTPFQIDSVTASSILKWLESGYIFNQKGTIYSWHDPSNCSTPFEYYEITGYYLTLTSYLFQLGVIDNNSPIVEQASNAIEHLIDNYQNSIGGFYYKNDSTVSYSFDNMMIAFGLINYYKTFNHINALNLATNICDGFIEHWVTNTVVSLKDKDGNILDNSTTWSTSFGGFHLKSNLALISLYKISNNKKYHDIASKLSEQTIKDFYRDGTFHTYNDGGSHLHPLLYTLEGLIFKDITLQECHYKEEIHSTLNWIYSHNGNKLFRSIKKDSIYKHMRADIYFQLLRVSKISAHYYSLDLPFNYDEIEKEASQFQLDKSVFSFGLDSSGNKIDHLTSWVNFMALQYFVDKEIERPQILSEFLV